MKRTRGNNIRADEREKIVQLLALYPLPVVILKSGRPIGTLLKIAAAAYKEH